ncbi:MAG: CPBP family intramembrane metalloprotease [Clostridia bacterium]|nr:CPBP family intramembrane metalloprotease [Clostridia bacterium]
MKTQKYIIIAITAFACLCMGLVDAVIQPGYMIKSAIKIVLFLLLPILYSLYNKDCKLTRLFKPDKKGIWIALGLGVGVYAVILAAYFLFRNVFDFSALTTSLTSTTGVNKNNFIFVAIYISFANSLLEEFFFRGFAFLTLKKVSNRGLAYIISAAMFALYHIAMMIGWFGLPVIILAMIGLFIGGIIFNFFNEKYNNIYLSWLIHMFSNFATNTIGFILFNV